MKLALGQSLFVALLCLFDVASAWMVAAPGARYHLSPWTGSTPLHLPSRSSPALASNACGSDDASGEGGADLAAELFRVAKQKGIALDASDLLEEEEEEEDVAADADDDDDEIEPKFPKGAIKRFGARDIEEKLSGNISLTNEQLFSEVKERVLDTAGGFVAYVESVKEDDEDDEGEIKKDVPKIYKPPTTIPDTELSADEVVLQVLESLRNNNVPTPNMGVQILFGFSSPTSQIKTEVGLTPAEYAEFLLETEYKFLLDPSYDEVSIENVDYSLDGQKAFFTVRVVQSNGGAISNPVNVNFILSSCTIPAGVGAEDSDEAWMVDSILIRPQSMRRRRRR